MNTERKPKAADIPDQVIYAFIRQQLNSLSSIQEGLDMYPAKVVHAKLAQMIYKGRLFGCPCGCPGNFAIPPTPEEGRAVRARRLAMKASATAPADLSRWLNCSK